MKMIIAGSRSFVSSSEKADEMMRILDEYKCVSEVVSGACRGADQIGEIWGNLSDIPVMRFWADWDYHGKAAGPIRNKQMAEYADEAIIFYDGKPTRGSQNLASHMKALGKPYKEITL